MPLWADNSRTIIRCAVWLIQVFTGNRLCNPPLDSRDGLRAMQHRKECSEWHNDICHVQKMSSGKTKPLLSVKFLFLQVYNVCSDTFDSYDQHYGRGLVKDTIKDGMLLFRGVFRKYRLGSLATLANLHFWLMSKVEGKYFASIQ